MDQWPLADSGFSARVVNAASAAGLTTVGDVLHAPDGFLLDLRSIGIRSIEEIHFFRQLADDIASGRKVFITLQEVFDLFLDDEEMTVLEKRVGLRRADMDVSGNHMTLQEIGNEMQRTRERVRQVEEVARTKINSRMARLCLSPFYLYVRSFIEKCGGVVTCGDLSDLDGQAWLTGYNPCAVLLLLHQLNPARLAMRHMIFTTRDSMETQAVEHHAVAALRDAGHPLSLADIQQFIHQQNNTLSGWSEQALKRLLDAIPGLLATQDELYALEDQADYVIRRVMEQESLPAHYRVITKAFNNAVLSNHQKGSGFTLKILNTSPLFIKTGRGTYDLAP